MQKNGKLTKYQKYQKMLRNNTQFNEYDDDQKPDLSSLSLSYINTQDNSPRQKQEVFQLDFDFDCKKILHLWLCEIIPGAQYLGLSYDFQNKKIIGSRAQCRRKLSECQNFIQVHKLKMYSLKQLLQNEQIYLVKCLNINIYRKQLIQKAAKLLISQYKLTQLKKQVNALLEKKYVYLMSIKKQEQDKFNQAIYKIRQIQITREHIRQLQQKKSYKQLGSACRQQRQKPKYVQKIRQQDRMGSQRGNRRKTQIPYSSSQQQDEQNQNNSSLSSEQLEPRFIRKQQQKQKQKYKKKQKTKQQQQTQTFEQRSQHLPQNTKNNISFNQQSIIIKNTNIKQPPKNNKQLVFQQQFNKSILSLPQLKGYLKMKKIFNIDEFQFQQTSKTIKISLCSDEKNREKKINSLNLYLKFQKTIILTQFNESCKLQLLANLSKFQKQSISLQYFSGYIKPQKKQHQVRVLYRQRKLTQSKTKQNTQKISFLYMKGIKPEVEQTVSEIKALMEQIQLKMRKNKTKTQKFTVDLPKIQEYLEEPRVTSLVKNIAVQILGKYDYIRIISIDCLDAQLNMCLQIKSQYFDAFNQKVLALVQKQTQARVQCQQIIDMEHLDKNLSDQFMLFQSKTNLAKAVLIEDSHNNFGQTVLKIMNCINSNQQPILKEVVVMKHKLPHLKQFLQNLKLKQANTFMKKSKFNYISQGNISKIEVNAPKRNIDKIINQINQQLNDIDSKILEKILYVSNNEAQIIEKNDQALTKKVEQTNGMSFNLSKNIQSGPIISLGLSPSASHLDNICIQILKYRNLSALPPNTYIVFLSQNDLEFVKEKTYENVISNFKTKLSPKSGFKMPFPQKSYQFLYFHKYEEKDVSQAIQQSIEDRKKNKKYCQAERQNFVFFMPKKNKHQLVVKIIDSFYKNSKENYSKIFIFDHSLQDIDKILQPLQKLVKSSCRNTIKTEFYIQDTHQLKQRYYSQQGNEKIVAAEEQGLTKIILTNSDLNLSQPTHLCSLKQQKLIHIQSKKQTKLMILADRVLFSFNGVFIQMDPQQVKKVQKNRNNDNEPWTKVSIGAYEIDLNKNIQTNLFSGFQRRIKKKVSVVERPFQNWVLKIDKDVKMNLIQILYKPQKQFEAERAIQTLKASIKNLKMQRIIKLKNKINEQSFRKIKQFQVNLNCQILWDKNDNIHIYSWDKNILQGVALKIQMMHADIKNQIKFPEYWSPQNSQIETFAVHPNSKQFKQVQDNFKIYPIKELLRIQNKILYQKFLHEKQSLKKLNGKYVKQMMLYHGTHSTDPKQIYFDKQQSFNINYTSENNYLGKAIYFAQKSQYSQSYQHAQLVGGQLIRSMFYCCVLVGDSQQFKSENAQTKAMKDSNYKDVDNKLRYESSSLQTRRSMIYAVYKNRRAYPNYLIKY